MNKTSNSPAPKAQLLVNDGILEAHDIAPLRPSQPTEDMDVLRERFDVDGYLFLKGVLPRDDVLACRAAYFAHMAPSGVLLPGSEPVDGIYDPDNDPSDYPNVGAGQPHSSTAARFLDMAEKAHTAPWYLDFSKHPALMKFVAEFSSWGEQTLLLPRSLLRNNTPANKAIGVHYDQIFLRKGHPTAITAWIPIGDIDIQGGGLIYLERSTAHGIHDFDGELIAKGDHLGQETEAAFADQAGKSGLTEDEKCNPFNVNMMSNGFLADGPLGFGRQHGRRWLVTAYEAGDVLLHKPHTIHASTINRDPSNKVRLGTDLRFVDRSKELDDLIKCNFGHRIDEEKYTADRIKWSMIERRLFSCRMVWWTNIQPALMQAWLFKDVWNEEVGWLK